MYERHDRPDSTKLEDAVVFFRVVRDEVRTVGLETAGVLAGHAATVFAAVTVKAHTLAGEWRGRADELAPSLPVPAYWQQGPIPVPDDDDELHRQAERAAAMRRHPAGTDR